MPHQVSRRMLMGLLMIAAYLSACSADEITPSEPKLDTAGAFIALERTDGSLGLYRVLSAFILQNGESLLFVSSYAVSPKSFEDAREHAKRHDLAVHTELTSLLTADVRRTRHQVVWFRTLTDQELAAFR